MENSAFATIERYERIKEWIRLKLHSYIVTVLTFVNVFILGVSAILEWISSWLRISSLSFIDYQSMGWGAFIFLWNLPLITWWYSTITFPIKFPIKKGHKITIDWAKTKKGRILSFSLNILPFFFLSWIAAGRYIHSHYEPVLEKIKVSPLKYDYLLVTDLNPLISFLYFFPAIISLIVGLLIYRHYQINKDILEKQFEKWEFPILTRFSYPLEMDKCDVIVGYDKKTKKPIVIKEKQRFLHELVTGATGSGKTSTTILLRIAQDLIKIATGRRKMGLVFLEPKGDGVDDVLMIAKKLGIPDEKIMVVDPTKSFSTKFNPFYGPIEAAAQAFQGTINALAGDQDDFFKGQQNEVAQSFTLLAKIRFGQLTNINHLQRMFTDPRYLANIVEDVRMSIDRKRKEENLSNDILKTLDVWESIVRYFEDEVLDYKTARVKDELIPVIYPDGHRYAGQQIVENKKDKYITGAKKYLNEISMNSLLSTLFVSADKDRVLDIDQFLKEGGVLLVNTALAELEELSLLFGQFFIRQFQSAVFRRPKEGRIPIFFYVDEFPLYVNEAFERMLTLGRSYQVGSLIAIQSLGQLENVARGYKETILTNTSSKTVFGRGTVEDNELFSKEFGDDTKIEESLNESVTPITVEKQNWGYRYNTQKKEAPRFTPTEIRELPFKHMIVQVVGEDNSIEVSTKAIGKFVNEAKFIKRYFKVANVELKSLKEKAVDIEPYIKSKKFNIEIKKSTQDLENIESNSTQQSDHGENESRVNTEHEVSEQTEDLKPHHKEEMERDDIEEQLTINIDVPEVSVNPTNKVATKKRTLQFDGEQIDIGEFTDISEIETQNQINELRHTLSESEHSVAPVFSTPDDEISHNVDKLVLAVQQTEGAKENREESEQIISKEFSYTDNTLGKKLENAEEPQITSDGSNEINAEENQEEQKNDSLPQELPIVEDDL